MIIQQNEKVQLENKGLKGTRPRLAVLHVLGEENRPLDVSEIIAGLVEHKVAADQATVYRILDVFAEKGLITRFDFQEGKFRYEKAGDTEHHHLICEQCGRIDDISDCNIAAFQESIAKKKHFVIKRHALEFYGLCQQCQR